MHTLGRGALEPLLIGVAMLVSAVHGIEVGYEDMGKAFLVVGCALIGAAGLYYFDARSRDPSARRPSTRSNALETVAE